MRSSVRPIEPATMSKGKVAILVGGIPSNSKRVDVFKYFNKIRVLGSIKYPYSDSSTSEADGKTKKSPEKRFNQALIEFEHITPAKNAIKQMEQVPFQVGEGAAISKNMRNKKRQGEQKQPQFDSSSTFFSAVLVSDLNSAAHRRIMKDGRLVVRNLSFKINEAKLAEAFERFGEVTEVRIPKKDNGMKRGFAFIQFAAKQNAVTAQREMNGKAIGDRTVTVERAVPKEVFATLSTSSDKASKMETDTSETTAVIKGQRNKADADDDSDDGSGSNEDEDSEGEEFEAFSPSKSRKIMFSDDDESSEDEDEKKRSVKEEIDDENSRKQNTKDAKRVNSDLANRNQTSGAAKKPPKQDLNDASDGKTLFVQNVPFDAEESAVKKVFEHFGAVEYCKLVRDRVSGLVRNAGFIRFANREDADRVLAATDEERDEVLRLDDTDRPPLVAMRAVTRDSLRNMLDERERLRSEDRHKDRRNLHLLSVRCSDERTLAALNEADRARRARIEEELNSRLRNPLVFVSNNRICLHNLPKNIDDGLLRRTLFSALGRNGAKPRITECRVIRDKARQAPASASAAAAPSRQYAFVSFQNHEDARRAILALDCNTTVFPNRIFAEFALENRARLRNKFAKIGREREQQQPRPGKQPPKQKQQQQQQKQKPQKPQKQQQQQQQQKQPKASSVTSGEVARPATKRAVVQVLKKLQQKRAKLA